MTREIAIGIVEDHLEKLVEAVEVHKQGMIEHQQMDKSPKLQKTVKPREMVKETVKQEEEVEDVENELLF
jgi:hypothetical protein